MHIFGHRKFVILLFLCLLNPLIKTSLSGENYSIIRPNGVERGAAVSIFSNQIDINSLIKLIEPDSASQVTSFTPTFIWHAVEADCTVEYRLLIAKIDGKIVLDEWVGPDTSYTISIPGYFEDLNPYYWSVKAFYGNRQAQSPLWSFWVDQDIVTDLTVAKIMLEQDKTNWNPGDEVKIQATIQNSGPIDAEGCFVTLYSGNINRNYFSYAAHRKTLALDTVFVPALKMNDPQMITLSARLPYGFNHFFARIDPVTGMKDVIYSNNYTNGITIQTEDRLLSLKSLFIIYTNYFDPEVGEKSLNQNDIVTLHQNISNFQHYFWDHTHIIQVQVDTFLIERRLSDKDFSYHNDQWGYFLSPNQVSNDLIQRNITEVDYDFMFVYYSWWNSKSSWSGYSGYTLQDAKLFNKKTHFLAQPVTAGKIEDEQTTIHEFLHLLDNLYEGTEKLQFYSPHHRMLYTTFEKNEDYFDWILETWPADKWFVLKIGQFINRLDATWIIAPAKIFDEPKKLILSQNYPNPFNKITTIIYKIPQLDSPSTSVKVRLVIYDILGNQIQTLVNTMKKPGTYRVYWNGKNKQGKLVASGIYFYELKTGNQRQVKKLLYIR